MSASRLQISEAPQRTPAATRPVRVLHSLAPPDGTTRYVDHMKGSAPAGVQTMFFSWQAAFAGRYDVFHLHWPELLVRRGRFGALLTRALLLRLRLTGRPLVRTLHNVEPHEASDPAEARLLAQIDEATDLFLRLNPATPVHPGWRVADIPHGDYRTVFARLPRPEPVPGRIASVGLIRPYKNIDGLLRAFAELEDAHVSLDVRGKPTPQLRDELESLARADPRVSLVLRFVPDAELVAAVSAAQLVALPYLEMHNSGVLLVALSLGRPALVPASPSNQALADEVGEGWVLQYRGALSPAILRTALADAARARTLPPPRLDARSWERIGALHEQAYRSVLEAAR